jgi:hypothetical protein
VYGEDTRRAVFVFQRNSGLRANGIVDPHIWYRLLPGAASPALSASPVPAVDPAP